MSIVKARKEQSESELKRSEKKTRSASPHEVVEDLQKATGTEAPDQLTLAAPDGNKRVNNF